ncbi:MAG TPA: hypothetical protein VFO10_04880 [Oligoflexus sp.]|uniref:hypothetical protein n=1 Tax=Oligoflexus sp. TaxID=1971216 RepID=UPI002D80382D|nr:hypothetical protein [Oligoflexus sp.]HET9236558.1 hypothetical protein [Oligoflexus sp.]
MKRTQLACLLSLLISTSSLVAAPFPFFEGKVQVPFSNHGSLSVEVLDQRFLKTTDNGNPHSEEIVLDLQTGRIETTTVDYTPNETKVTTSYEPADQGGAYLPYRRQLTALIGDVAGVQQRLGYLGKEVKQARNPEMIAVQQYLEDIRKASDDSAPDSVALTWIPRDLRRDVTYSITVEYLARENRQLLAEAFGGQPSWNKSTSVPVSKGYQTKDIIIKIPADAPLDIAGSIGAALVPAGAKASDDKLAESYLPASFKKTLMIVSTSASFLPFNSPRLAVYTNFFCPKDCEVRVDIFNSAGQWITSASTPAETSSNPFVEQFKQVNIPASMLPVGQDFTYFVKILPLGGSWDQYYDQMRGSFKIGN